jgi:CubicO group peptidase (beta-lactamase class C family)
MDRRSFLTSFAAGAAALAIPGSGQDGTVKDLSDQLEGVRKEHGLPGVAAAIARGKQVIAEGVAGVRRLGQDDKIKVEDRFLIGSCTKRMTGLAICRLIDKGQLSFDATLGQSLPDLQMRDEYRAVTLAQLLSFTGGIQPYTIMTPRTTPIIGQLKGSIAERREQLLRHVLQEEPIVKPGTERRYSNASYALAAFIAAKKAGRDFEDLLHEHVFQPLGLAKAGFGAPRTKEHPDEPGPHIKGPNGYEVEPENRPAPAEGVFLGAGGVHCTVRDLVRFASYELAAAQGHDDLLGPETARRWQELSTGARTEGQPIFGGTQSLTAAFAIWPSKNLAAAVTVNGGGANDACRAVIQLAPAL